MNDKTAYDSVTTHPGNQLHAVLKMYDVDNDPINYTWEVLPESTDLKDGGDKEERPENIDIIETTNQNGVLKFKAPVPGQYRLFVYADDGFGHSATANIPFMVK